MITSRFNISSEGSGLGSDGTVVARVFHRSASLLPQHHGYSVALLTALWLCGCGYFFVRHIAPLDKSKVELIKPGSTKFFEVLSLLGPPDAIIDGPQRIDTPYGIRPVAAPEGSVILYYSSADGGIVFPSTVERPQPTRADELYIFLSKKEKIVSAVTTKIPSE